MKKVLFVANHRGFSKFNAPYMKWFKNEGWQVDNASPGIEVGEIDNQYDIDICRSPFSSKNIKACLDLKKIIDTNSYDIVHVHTPMGAVIGRIAAYKARKKGAKVIYTAHGFHFFKGAPLKNWMVYYPIEKILSSLTDVLVTINSEDYEKATKMKYAHGHIYKIDGVGVDLDRFHPLTLEEKHNIRASMNIQDSDFVILYVAQFIPRKNHAFIIQNAPAIISEIPNARFVFAGAGDTLQECKHLADRLGVSHKINFLGGRHDIPELCGISDIHVASSLQEGQGINNIEAMATGKPLVISDVRGHRDVCIDGRNGFLFSLSDPKSFVDRVVKLYSDKNLYNKISDINIQDSKRFSIDKEVQAMAEIYKTIM